MISPFFRSTRCTKSRPKKMSESFDDLRYALCIIINHHQIHTSSGSRRRCDSNMPILQWNFLIVHCSKSPFIIRPYKNPFRREKPNKVYRCKCNRPFTKSYNSKRHKDRGTCAKVMQALTKKVFYCVECETKFSTMSNLKHHKVSQFPYGPRMAVQRKKAACPDCDETFSHSSNLGRHQKSSKCTARVDASPENDDNNVSDESDE